MQTHIQMRQKPFNVFGEFVEIILAHVENMLEKSCPVPPILQKA